MAKQPQCVVKLAKIFRLLGDQTRLRILMQLQGGEQNVSKIVMKLKIPQPTVSHHLSLLRMNELVTARRKGKEVFYSLNGNLLSDQRYLKDMLRDKKVLKIGKLLMGLSK